MIAAYQPSRRTGKQQYIDQQLKEMMDRDPVFAPHLKPPPDWVGWRKENEDRQHATFVRDWRSKDAITEAFPEEHARGVDALNIARRLC